MAADDPTGERSRDQTDQDEEQDSHAISSVLARTWAI
jgi:hypothetical protein